MRENAAAAVETQHAKAVYVESQWSAWKQNALDWQAYAEQLEAQPQEVVYVEGYRTIEEVQASSGYANSDLEARIAEAEYEAQQASALAAAALGEAENTRIKAKRAARNAARRQADHESDTVYLHGY